MAHFGAYAFWSVFITGDEDPIGACEEGESFFVFTYDDIATICFAFRDVVDPCRHYYLIAEEEFGEVVDFMSGYEPDEIVILIPASVEAD